MVSLYCLYSYLMPLPLPPPLRLDHTRVLQTLPPTLSIPQLHDVLLSAPAPNPSPNPEDDDENDWCDEPGCGKKYRHEHIGAGLGLGSLRGEHRGGGASGKGEL